MKYNWKSSRDWCWASLKRRSGSLSSKSRAMVNTKLRFKHIFLKHWLAMVRLSIWTILLTNSREMSKGLCQIPKVSRSSRTEVQSLSALRHTMRCSKSEIKMPFSRKEFAWSRVKETKLRVTPSRTRSSKSASVYMLSRWLMLDFNKPLGSGALALMRNLIFSTKRISKMFKLS